MQHRNTQLGKQRCLKRQDCAKLNLDILLSLPLSLDLWNHALEKEMATHSSVLALRISGTREPGGLPSMGSHRVGHD